MDFGHFGDNTPRDHRQPQQPPRMEGQGNANGEGNRNNGNGEPSEPVFMHTMEHSGVTCDVCSGAIRGFRYKCMECPDFDLCTTCERKGHHPGHVMMRIAFPEQARSAIRRFVGTVPGAGISHHGLRHAGVGGQGGPFGFGFPFEGLHHGHHRARGCHRPATAGGHAGGNAKDSDDSGPEDPKTVNDCPYGLGRKGMKKWAKCMKKMAYQQRRSADAYARSCAQTAAQAAGVSAEGFDFTAAASQIQEFLNAFGIPIDVVELYDSYGGNQREQRDANANHQPAGGQENATSAGNAASGVVHDTSTSENIMNTTAAAAGNNNGGSTPPQSNLSAHLQQLHLNSNSEGVNGDRQNESVPSAPAENPLQAVTMELDSDSAGWTILDNNERGTTGDNQQIRQASPPASLGSVTAVHQIPVIPDNGNGAANASPITGANGGRLYPGLSPPQLQQLLSGVSQAMNSVVRNIPIVTNPSGPAVRQGGDISGPPSVTGEMDVKCTTTLNQLLAMGFSNHDSWLSRLVIAKNGELEAVLNALFPTGAQ